MNPMNADCRTTTLQVLGVVMIVLAMATPDIVNAANPPVQNSGIPLSISNLQTQVSGLQSSLSATQSSVADLGVALGTHQAAQLNDVTCIFAQFSCPQGFVAATPGSPAAVSCGNDPQVKACVRGEAPSPGFGPPTPKMECETGYELLTRFPDGSPVPPAIVVCQQTVREGMRVISVYGTRADVDSNGASIELQCPAPFVVTGGGFKSNLQITGNLPVPPWRWRVSGRLDLGVNDAYGTLMAYAVCTQLDP
jgi:hypothetical protein